MTVPAFIVAWIFLSATGECGAAGGCIATATVEGRQYAQSISRGLQINAADLMPYAIATRRSRSHETLDEQTYRLGGLDPTQVLVMKLVPGQADDAGSIGSFLVLFGGGFDSALLCPYQPTSGPLRPAECT